MNNIYRPVTPGQVAQINERAQERLRFAISTSPIEKRELEYDIGRYYRMSKLDPPAFLWLRSPLEACACAALIWMVFGARASKFGLRDLRSSFGTDWWQSLFDQLEPQLSEELHQRLRASFSRCHSATRFLSLWWQILFESELGIFSLNLRGELEREARQVGVDVPPHGLGGLTEQTQLLRSRLLFLMLQNRANLRTRFEDGITSLIIEAVGMQANVLGIPLPVPKLAEEGMIVVKNQAERIAWPAWEYTWLHELLAVRDVLGSETLGVRAKEQLSILESLLSNSFACIFFPALCILSERPCLIAVDEQLRLHNESDAAISFQDGTSFYSWRGANVPEFAIRARETLTARAIIEERNLATRRALIDIYGGEKFLVASGAKVVGADEFGVLYRSELPDDEALVMVKVVNSSPEPDGTYKDYFLRVPPGVTTAREAVAWTFGLDQGHYSPAIQT